MKYEMWLVGKISGINLIDCMEAICFINSLKSLLHAFHRVVNHEQYGEINAKVRFFANFVLDSILFCCKNHETGALWVVTSNGIRRVSNAVCFQYITTLFGL